MSETGLIKTTFKILPICFPCHLNYKCFPVSAFFFSGPIPLEISAQGFSNLIGNCRVICCSISFKHWLWDSSVRLIFFSVLSAFFSISFTFQMCNFCRHTAVSPVCCLSSLKTLCTLNLPSVCCVSLTSSDLNHSSSGCCPFSSASVFLFFLVSESAWELLLNSNWFFSIVLLDINAVDLLSFSLFFSFLMQRL